MFINEIGSYLQSFANVLGDQLVDATTFSSIGSWMQNKNCTITGHPRIFLHYEEFAIPCDSDVTEPKSNQNEPRVPYVGVNS